MSSGSYFPPPVKACRSREVRASGYWHSDGSRQIAQTAVKMWLEPRLDPIFRPDSYGYRPGKSALAAITVTRRRCWDYDWVVEFDIRGLLEQSRSRPADEGSSQALSGAMDLALRGTLAESANADHGRADPGSR